MVILDTFDMCNANGHSPGCTCGFGGEGHAGRTSGGRPYTPSARYWSGVREWRVRDFTNTSRCPVCGADVFFIRHNGGCVWVDPPLGPPWDKHGCFDKPNEPTRVFSGWSCKSSGLTNPKLGVIKRVSSENQQGEPLIEIEMTDASYVSLVLRWTPADHSIVGSLVIISEEDQLLLHQRYAEIAFHCFTRMPRPVRCPTKEEEKFKASLKRQNWSDLELTELERKFITEAWEDIPAGNPLQVEKAAKALILERVQKLPHHLRGQMLHRFEKNNWKQIAYFG